MKIDNLSLRVKALMPLAIMCLAVAGMAAFGAWRLDYVEQRQRNHAHRDKAAIYRCARDPHEMMAPYAVFGALVYDGSSPEGRTAQADFSARSTSSTH